MYVNTNMWNKSVQNIFLLNFQLLYEMIPKMLKWKTGWTGSLHVFSQAQHGHCEGFRPRSQQADTPSQAATALRLTTRDAFCYTHHCKRRACTVMASSRRNICLLISFTTYFGPITQSSRLTLRSSCHPPLISILRWWDSLMHCCGRGICIAQRY